MMFSSLTFERPHRRLIGWVISFLIFCFGFAFLAGALLSAERPLFYLHGWSWATALSVFLGNVLLQLPLVFTDHGLGEVLAERRRSPAFSDHLARFFAAVGALTLAGGAVVLAFRAKDALRTAGTPAEVRDYTAMCITAALVGTLLLAGSIGLCLRCFALGRFPAAEVVLHLPLPLACVGFSLYLYFDKSVPRNATLKLAVSLAFLLLALLLLLRIREMVGSPRPRLAVYLARAAVPYTGALSLVLLFLFIVRKEVFVSFTICLFLAFLSFYFYMIFLVPTIGVSERYSNLTDADDEPDSTDSGTRDADAPGEE